MRKNSKKRQAKFIKDIRHFMSDIDAEVIEPLYEGYGDSWLIDTIHGKLRVNLPHDQDYTFTVFCKFQEQEKYSKFDCLRVNKYSGKCNFHYSKEEDSVYMFKLEVNRILIKK